jgi:hypothetical protein
VSEDRFPPVDGQNVHADAQKEKLKRYLPKTEHLIWTGSPQLSRLILRNAFRTAVMILVGSIGLYFLYGGITPTDLCGSQMSKLCRKFYFWPWLGLVAASFYIPFLWLSFLLHASGLLREIYGLTDRQALKLRSNPFDRFQSGKLTDLTKDQMAVRRWFGSIAFGPTLFLSLHNDDIARLTGITEGWHSDLHQKMDVPDIQESVH